MSTPLVFVVLRHVRNADQDALWRRAVSSVQRWHADVHIVVIDDNSPLPVTEIDGIPVIYSEFPGAGEVLPYYYFLKHRWADRMVFLHDSMFLRRAFTNEELSFAARAHWHFADHCWDEDWRIEPLFVAIEHADELRTLYAKKDRWNGCQGAATNITLAATEALETKYALFSRMVTVLHDRNDRKMFERLLGLALTNEGFVTVRDTSNFGDIYAYHHYELVTHSNSYLLEKHFPGAVVKVFQGR